MQIYTTLTRIFVASTELDSSIEFYEQLFGKECELRFAYPEAGLELAMIDSILLISGSPNHLRPFQKTQVTFLVDSVDEFFEFFTARQISILDLPKAVPTGKNMRVQHPDGMIAEYVEHTK